MLQLRPSALLVIAAALLGGPAAPLRVPTHQDDMVVKHKWDVIPVNWINLGPPPDDTAIDLHIALQPNQKNALTDVLYEVSQPGHPKYGGHLSRDQVAQLVAPHPNTLKLVTSWLKHDGVPTSSISRTHGGGWLTVSDVPVTQANKLLGASYRLYYHAGRNDTILRTVSYALPGTLHVHVKTVVPTTAFMSTRPLQQTSRRRSGEASAPNVTSGGPVDMLSRRQEQVIEPSILRELYKTDTYAPPVAENSRLGIVGYADEYPDLSNKATFIRLYMTGDHDETVTWETINHRVPYGHTSKQANLFTQFAAAILYPIPITFYRGTGDDDAIHQWLRYATDLPRNPHTIGLMSDGVSETNLPPDYMEAVCDLFKNLGTRGTTVLVPSGDLGAGSGATTKFSINFPASCPYVTSVGGTMRIPEVASNFSGGGFSRYFDVEPYQKDEVNAFVQSLGKMYRNRYAPGGRGVPDIAAQSSKYIYYWKRNEYDDISKTALA